MDDPREVEYLKNYKPSIDDLKMKSPALISEGYVDKDIHDRLIERADELTTELEELKLKYDELLQQRDELLKTMKSIYCTTDASDQNSMQHAIYRIGAAIKNTEQ